MPGLTLPSETDCWDCLRNDDPRAIGYLYDTYVDKLFISAMLVTDDRELAKDALQEVFIEIWNYRKTIGDVRSSQAYLTRILKRILFKKQRTGSHVNLLSDPAEMISAEYNAEELMIFSDTEREKQSRLRIAVSELTVRQRQIVELRFYQGLTYEQIAERMGMNYQSVNNLAFRTFRRLRGAISPVLLAFSIFF